MRATLQDQGRPGMQRYGVPPSGPMDAHAAVWANRLVGNEDAAVVAEFSPQVICLRATGEAWLALTGADLGWNVPMWQRIRVRPGDLITCSRMNSGVWSYLAVEGGFQGASLLGSVSGAPSLRLGTSFGKGGMLEWISPREQQPPARIRTVAGPPRDYSCPPVFEVFHGPQWELFPEDTLRRFFENEWRISSRISRAGYRLEGPALPALGTQLISEPVRIGTIQLPDGGQPIITLQDGPTVGGYAKLGWIHPSQLSWLTQCRPGQPVRFVPTR